MLLPCRRRAFTPILKRPGKVSHHRLPTPPAAFTPLPFEYVNSIDAQGGSLILVISRSEETQT